MMNQNEFGKLIKEIRRKNNLTQKELADKYHVTYQAVSKWENGKNMPDVSLIKDISRDFNVSIDDLLEGNYNKKRKKKWTIYIILILLVSLITTLGIIFLNGDSDFEFRTLSSNCDIFSISGSIAYNKKKSSIYITNIEYCGEEDNTVYKRIECNLYENNINLITKISSYVDSNITLKEFLKRVTLSVNNYDKICRVYSDNSLYLEIECTNSNDVITTYKVPLSMKSDCGGN